MVSPVQECLVARSVSFSLRSTNGCQELCATAVGGGNGLGALQGPAKLSACVVLMGTVLVLSGPTCCTCSWMSSREHCPNQGPRAHDEWQLAVQNCFRGSDTGSITCQGSHFTDVADSQLPTNLDSARAGWVSAGSAAAPGSL